MIVKVIAFTVLYFAMIPLFFIAKNSMSNKKIKPDPNNLPFDKKIKRWKKFGFSEFSKKNLLKVIYAVSIILAPLLSLVSLVPAIIVVLLAPWIFVIINYNLVKTELSNKDVLITRLLEFKRSKMGFVEKKTTIFDYENEFQILEYDEHSTDLRPTKLRFNIPVTFDPLNKSRFLADLSIQFGGGRPYEVDEDDKDFPGWNPEKGKATVALQEPLPTIAKWSAHYLEDPLVQWSFFPLGLGSKGGIPIKNPETGLIENVIGIDVDGSQRKACEKAGIRVGSDIVASPMTLIAGVTGGGKSVAQWNLMNSCLARPKQWLLFGMDMKKVELSQLRQFGVAVGTTYKDCCDIAVFVQKVMMDRYELMESLGINNWGDLPEGHPAYGSPAILLLCDEAGELLSPISGKDDESKANQEAQDMIRAAMESIARLGRASRVFLVAAAQRPEASVISMQIRQNMSNKLACGTIPSAISQMVFENSEGARIPGNPRGRCAIKIHSSEVNHFQGFFSPGADWLKEYAKSKGWPINIYGEYVNNDIAKDYENSKDSGPAYEDAMSEDEFALLDMSK